MIEKTKEAYDSAFEAEREVNYTAIKELERRLSYAIDRTKLEHAARYLACPIKVNPPNWQHGRVVYAVARKRLESCADPVVLLDIGTAKGFSALCALWALNDSRSMGTVYSVDVIDPDERVERNTVLDVVFGPQPLRDILLRWPEAEAIHFKKSTGVDWLEKAKERVHFAFIDGKHVYEAVREELRLLVKLQRAGDVIVLDDVHIPGIARALDEGLRGEGRYAVEKITVLPNRAYAIAWRIA